MYKFFIIVFMLAILSTPLVSFAQTEGHGLIPCGQVVESDQVVNNGITYKKGEVVSCGFRDLMLLINKVIDFVFKKLALPIAAIMFAYAGFLMVTAGGSTEAAGKARKIFTSVVLGLILAGAAWLIVKTFLSVMGYTDAGLFFLNN